MKYFKIIAWGECPFCVKAKAALIERNYEFEYHVMDHASERLKFYKSNYNMKTVPIVVMIDEDLKIEETIGGYTDLAKFLEGGTGEDSQEDDL